MPASTNAGHYAEIVRETATLRGLILAGGEIAQLGWDREGEPAELVARAEQLVFELAERRADGELVLFKDTLVETFQRISHLYESGADVTGLASGFKDLDKLTAGFQPSNLDDPRGPAFDGEERLRARDREPRRGRPADKPARSSASRCRSRRSRSA